MGYASTGNCLTNGRDSHQLRMLNIVWYVGNEEGRKQQGVDDVVVDKRVELRRKCSGGHRTPNRPCQAAHSRYNRGDASKIGEA